MKRVFIGFGSVILITFLAIFIWVALLPDLPEKTEANIQKILQSPLPELITGQASMVNSNGVKIWYQSRMPNPLKFIQPKGVVMLVNGLGSSGIFWPQEVITTLLDNGYRVIVSDHRGVGESDWLDDTVQYDLEDMVQDNLAILNALKIEKVHLVGLSMGGMIGQTMALTHEGRVQSLTSVMSSGFQNDPEFPDESSFKYNAIRVLLRFGVIKSEENTMKMLVSIYNLLKGKAAIDIDYVATATLYELRYRKGFNHLIADQHAQAIKRSGSRLVLLSNLKTPVLVVHGDADPLLNVEHAEKYASKIEGAETFWVDGMGHGLAPEYTRKWMARTVSFMDNNNAQQ